MAPSKRRPLPLPSGVVETDTTPPPPAAVGNRDHARSAREKRRERELRAERAAAAATVALDTNSENAELVGPGSYSLVDGTMQQSPLAYVAVDLMMRDFKTTACRFDGSMQSHDHRCCPFYHSDRDRRRLSVGADGQHLYCAEPCPDQFDDHRLCYSGDECGYCHNTTELLYHPDFFRKRLCHLAKRCPRQRFCAFAHSRQELLVPNFQEQDESTPTEEFIAHKFKTQWCPTGGPHDWENCVYAHTYRDWRRDPVIGYSSRPCPHWLQSISVGSREMTYSERCPRGVACPMAHGAKEQLYHPQFYKTSPCIEPNCSRGALCAFMHGPDDTRQQLVDEQRQNQRDPIPGAVEVIEKLQPSYWNPPRYHALEENPRGITFGFGFGKSASSKGGLAQQPRKQKNQRSWRAAQSFPDAAGFLSAFDTARQGEYNPQQTSAAGFASNDPQAQESYCASYMYQWMPGQETSAVQLLPPPFGYGETQAVDPWTLSPVAVMGDCPWSWANGSGEGNNPSMQFAYQTQGQQQYFMCNSLPHQYSPSDLTPQNQFAEPSTNLQLLYSRTIANRKPKNHQLYGGLRTPSSIGTPCQTATPSEAASPRGSSPRVQDPSAPPASSDSSSSGAARTSGSANISTIADVDKFSEAPLPFRATVLATSAHSAPTIG